MRHRMRDFGERQLPKGFCRANPLKLCEFADRMLGTEKTSAKENFMRRVLLPTMVFCFFASGHFVSAAPQAEQKMEELSHPKTLEELQKAMKEVVEKNHVTGAGGTGLERAAAMVRRSWQSGPGREQGYCLRHRISRRLH